MATGSLFDTSNLNLTIYSPIDCIALGNVVNGYINIYNDDDPNCFDKYCEYIYCNSGYIYPENTGFYDFTNTGENLTGFYCCIAKSDGTGSYYWDTIYCSGTILNITSGNSGYNFLNFYCSFETNHINWFNSSISFDGKFQGFVSIDCSLFISTNSGLCFEKKDICDDFRSISISNNAEIISAITINNGLYASFDCGDTWQFYTNEIFCSLYDIDTSAFNGSYALVGSPGYIYTTFNDLNCWCQRTEIEKNWTSVKTSNNGQVQVAVSYSGDLYVSNDCGLNWEQKETGYLIINDTGSLVQRVDYFGNIDTGEYIEIIEVKYNRAYTDVAISKNGRVVSAADNCGNIYISYDSGNNWTNKLSISGSKFSAIAISCDGKNQTAVEYLGYIYYSTNTGCSWQKIDCCNFWQTISMSDDGCVQILASYCDCKLYNLRYCEDILYSNLTGLYCCVVYADGVEGTFSKKIPYYGTILSSSGYFISIFDHVHDNGSFDVVFDGSGSTFCKNSYCPFGFAFVSNDNFEYVSDQTGSYFLREVKKRDLYSVCLKMDFSEKTKSTYGFSKIDACGENIYLSFKDTCAYFYEINTFCETTVCILEADKNESIYLDDVNKPFLYVKNIGDQVLNLKLSNNNYYENFKECQIFIKTFYSGKNISLAKDEHVFISLNVSTDGSKYYSESCFPFGFFYEFKDVEFVNQLGLFPSCCAYDCENNCYFPIYTYSNICNLPICDCNVIFDSGYGFNYQKQLTFGNNLTVDECSVLEISLFKQTGEQDLDFYYIETGINLNSNFGLNNFNSNIKINDIYILDSECGCIPLLNKSSFEKTIYQNSCLNIIYDFELCKQKNYYLIYLDCNCNIDDYSLILSIKNDSVYTYFDRSGILEQNGIFNINNNSISHIEIYLGECSAIKNLSNAKINRDNLFLPLLSEFNYCYCFPLKNSSTISEKCYTGFWCNCINIESGFCNYSTIINCADDEYQQYKSNLYTINLINKHNEINSNYLLNKDNDFDKTEDFIIYQSAIECSFIYCDLEFKYFPVEKIFYKNNTYEISCDSIPIEFCISGQSEIVNFPINAINENKLKIISTFGIFDYIKESLATINYDNFNFNLKCNQNYSTYTFPIIRSQNLSGYEYPSVCIENTYNNNITINTCFYINPLNNFTCDVFYGMSDFLLFLNSKLNSGMALDFINCETKIISDYCYGSADYSFLMIDLKCEFVSCNFQTMTSSWMKIDEKIFFEDNLNFISFKNNTGQGYNYILSVIDEISYSDVYQKSEEFFSGNLKFTGILNIDSANSVYDGSSTSEVFSSGYFTGLIDISGEIVEGSYLSGYCQTVINSGSSFSFCCNFNCIKVINLDLTGSNCRNIEIYKNFNLTGIQPLYIYSNYHLAELSSPIVYSNFKKYNADINGSGNLYYYLYDARNPKNENIKIVSPDLTIISGLSFNEKDSNIFSQRLDLAYIKNNFAKINLDIKSFIYENPIIINSGLFKNLCISIIGGL